MRVIGIDPGSRFTGYGILEGPGGTPRHLDNGVLVLPPSLPMAERLARLSAGLTALVEEHRPEAAAMETVFTHRNVKSALVLAQARGAALAVFGRFGVPVFEYAPAAIKTAVTGYGRAEKEQIQKMMRILLKLPEDAASDASDALAAACCHLRTVRLSALTVTGRA